MAGLSRNRSCPAGQRAGRHCGSSLPADAGTALSILSSGHPPRWNSPALKLSRFFAARSGGNLFVDDNVTPLQFLSRLAEYAAGRYELHYTSHQRPLGQGLVYLVTVRVQLDNARADKIAGTALSILSSGHPPRNSPALKLSRFFAARSGGNLFVDDNVTPLQFLSRLAEYAAGRYELQYTSHQRPLEQGLVYLVTVRVQLDNARADKIAGTALSILSSGHPPRNSPALKLSRFFAARSGGNLFVDDNVTPYQFLSRLAEYAAGRYELQYTSHQFHWNKGCLIP